MSRDLIDEVAEACGERMRAVNYASVYETAKQAVAAVLRERFEVKRVKHLGFNLFGDESWQGGGLESVTVLVDHRPRVDAPAPKPTVAEAARDAIDEGIRDLQAHDNGTREIGLGLAHLYRVRAALAVEEEAKR